MRILRAGQYTRMPWKNGGGETVEIAVHPAGASIEDFGWRVSMATVASDGPFSLFPGIDRTLSVLEGEGMVLTIGDSAPITLTAASAPLSFPADIPTSAQLVGGPITDLNVMTRRGHFKHRVERHHVSGVLEVEMVAGLLFSCARHLKVASGANAVELDFRDALEIHGPQKPILVAGQGPLYVIRLE
ncbi:HutD family protein [Mesorhizobium sp. VNQ89]|uniref:HutD/Ves family protein n=1 Tax=Mesorhizobium quangtriensis TaxID=3157709 RepID=UPI0032B7632D